VRPAVAHHRGLLRRRGGRGQGCVESWSDAQSSGSRFCASGAAFLDVTFKTCAGANVAILGALGTPRIYFYSAASGSLVGIEDLTSTGAKVVAGFVPHVALSACSQIGTMACPTPP
jgi:hypothetical protein